LKKYLTGIPSERGRILYEFILDSNMQNILELGFAHGKSTLYMAAALDEIGRGSVITIDKQNAKERDPNIIALLENVGLKQYVDPIFANRSYTWELMKLIERNTHNNYCKPLFDFCFIDGGHTWDVTGFGFLLVEKLLMPNGWILFDDLAWTIESSARIPDARKEQIPEEERKTAQGGKAFSLLVKQHPNFHNFKDDGWWGWAQKKPFEEQSH
jgi:predicted O-methyltransferase YrrM